MDADSYYNLVTGSLGFLNSEENGFTPVFKNFRSGQFAQSSVIFQSEVGRILIAYNEWDRDTYIKFAQGKSSSPDYGLNNHPEWLDIRQVMDALGLPGPDSSVLMALAVPERQIEYWVQLLAPHWAKILAFLSSPEFHLLVAEQERSILPTRRDVKRSSKRKDVALIPATLLFIGSLYFITILSLPRRVEQSLTCTVLVIFVLALFGPPLRSKYLARHKHSQK